LDRAAGGRVPYGKELVLDLHGYNPEVFNREDLGRFFKELCDLIDMERHDLYFWDYEEEQEEYDKAPDHLKGTSAIQFITTSNVTIHTLDVLRKVFINVFSCKEFDESVVIAFTSEWFDGKVINKQVVMRL